MTKVVTGEKGVSLVWRSHRSNCISAFEDCFIMVNSAEPDE